MSVAQQRSFASAPRSGHPRQRASGALCDLIGGTRVRSRDVSVCLSRRAHPLGIKGKQSLRGYDRGSSAEGGAVSRRGPARPENCGVCRQASGLDRLYAGFPARYCGSSARKVCVNAAGLHRLIAHIRQSLLHGLLLIALGLGSALVGLFLASLLAGREEPSIALDLRNPLPCLIAAVPATATIMDRLNFRQSFSAQHVMQAHFCLPAHSLRAPVSFNRAALSIAPHVAVLASSHFPTGADRG